MGLLDFFTQPKLTATPGQINENQRAYDQNGLLTDVGPMQGAPVLKEQPSLLSRVGNFLTSPQNMAAIGAALHNASGGSGGVEMAQQIGERRRQEEKQAVDKAKALADLQRKNAAFKAAYRNGKFDPQAYIDAIGDTGDATEAFSLAKALAPQGGVDGGTAYTRDPITGEVTWGEQRPMSYAEQQAIERDRALEEYRRAQLEDADERIAISRSREGRISRGGGGGRSGGGAVPALPPGFVIEK